MPVGSKRVFWSVQGKFFTTPFITTSLADPQKEVSEIWDGTWILPFEIHALGRLDKRLSIAEVWQTLPFLHGKPRTNISHVLNLTPLLYFVSKDMPDATCSPDQSARAHRHCHRPLDCQSRAIKSPTLRFAFLPVSTIVALKPGRRATEREGCLTVCRR